VLVVLLAAGAALHFTQYGMFGVYFFDRFMPGAGDPAQVASAIRQAEEKAQTDRWVDLRESLRMLGAARRGAGLNRELLARSLVQFYTCASTTIRAPRVRRRSVTPRQRRAEGCAAFAADACAAVGWSAQGSRRKLSATRRAIRTCLVAADRSRVASRRGRAAFARAVGRRRSARVWEWPARDRSAGRRRARRRRRGPAGEPEPRGRVDAARHAARRGR
jgi:hypothetical protein